MVPIETPLNFAGFNENVVPEFAPEFQQMGMTVGGGGGASTMISPKPVKGWEQSLQPGDAVSGILVTGDMSISAMCTVTYNDGKHVLFCGHSFFNLGPDRYAHGEGRCHHHAGVAVSTHQVRKRHRDCRRSQAGPP